MNRPLRLAALAAAVTLALTACNLGGGTKSSAPEPTPGHVIDGTGTTVIRMPDGFRNVVFTCFGPNGVYVTSRGGDTDTTLPSSVFVLANDPHCAK